MRYTFLFLSLLFIAAPSVLGQSIEEEAIRDLFLEQFVAHWQGAAPEALAALWHAEGDWMNLVGSRRVSKGSVQIKEVWSVGLQGRDSAEARRLIIEIDSIKLLSSSLAQVDLVMTFGHESTGMIREAMFAILQKDETGWKILSSRVARISSTPALR